MNYIKFYDKNIVFKKMNSIFWISIKSVCEALNVNFNRQFQNIKDDPILGSKFAKQQILVPGDSQPRKYICLPEEYIYGWVFSIKSESRELLKYKEECYHILFQYFKGTITKRAELYSEAVQTKKRKIELETLLFSIPEYIEYKELDAKEMQLWKSIRKTANDESSLFDNENFD